MENVIEVICKRSGVYSGSGVNHEGQDFEGELRLSEVVNGRGIQVEFIAKGVDGENYHKELSLIAIASDGKIKMWNLNSNKPTATEHRLMSSSDSTFVFRHGDLSDVQSFREEIHLELLGEKVGYHYHWGLPGGEFKYRSGLEMERTPMNPEQGEQ